MTHLLDTNAVIELLNGRSSQIATRLRAHRPADVAISAIVAHELYFVAFRSQRKEHNLSRLDALQFEVLSFDKEDAIAAGEIRAQLRATGTPVGPYDVLIAGQALCRNLTLVTANYGEFQRIAGLKVEDWSKE